MAAEHKIRAGVILIEDGQVALIERRRAGRLYYLFPGGGQEPGESPDQAAVREAYEELGLQVALIRLVAEVHFGEQTQYFYLARRLGGEFGAGQGEEMDSPEDSKAGSYKPLWVRLAHLPNLPLRPRPLANWIQQADAEQQLGREGWPQTPIVIIEN